MAKNPYDDVFRDLARVLEDLFSSLARDENARFVGCTIITGSGGEPRFFQIDDQGVDDINFETVEGPETVYVTIELPADTDMAPYAEIEEDSIHLYFEDDRITIDLPCRVDASQSEISVKNGIMDIVCHKLAKTPPLH
ncbi:MAG: hypothetical protein APR53_04465 [Methanoculleus sp. SDB]|nr:MAG: hypothetical protein APR53_04465 [Methanoculleus sp. SDB]